MVIIDREKPTKTERDRIDREINECCKDIRNLQLIDKLPLSKDDKGKIQSPAKSVCKLVTKFEGDNGREYMLCFGGGKLLKNGERLYAPSSFYVEGTRNIKPTTSENKMLIWFLTKVMSPQTLRKSRIHINDVEGLAKEANEVDMDMFEAGLLIKKNLTEDQIKLISPSWGVVNTDKSIDLLRKELWDKVCSMKGNSYVEFIRQASTFNVTDEILVRSTVNEAVLSKDIVFENMGWHFNDRDGQICYVNPRDNERKEEVLIKFLMDNDDHRNDFLVVMGVKDDNSKYSIADLDKKTIAELDQLAKDKDIVFPEDITLKRDKVSFIVENL